LTFHIRKPKTEIKCNIIRSWSVHIIKMNILLFFKALIAERTESMKINIKKAAAFLAVLTFGCAAVFAEPPPPCAGSPPPDSNMPVCEGKRPAMPFQHPWFTQELGEKLNLTDEQKTAIEQIIADEAKKIQEVRENSRKQINAVLTPEQQKELAAIRSEKRPAAPGRAWNRFQMFDEILGLTEAQKAAIGPILAAEANDIKAVRQDNSLSDEQKKGKAHAIRTASKEKIDAILKWNELKENRMQMRHKGMRHGPGQEPCEPPPPPPGEQEPADSNS
jgi:Spy/CpxP family protein refolding chaperone